ncbi:glycosyltransferase family 2 protein [Weeksella sp. HMSC059D05]|uniref:glycosyltransferase family 2 protein n=1 Tax=Weeksella sp. HMSC059D05 TaxID=1715139 RepID=UPI0008A418D8|nr:glycosyltransferase family 2 protein [Weeksella sp. HMSC059D05]OFM82684.1 hypothetical protein HMPREF2660_03245 [Weeksella sp. HMSC059D05]
MKKYSTIQKALEVDVIIPTYNSSRTIEKCLLSVLEQRKKVNKIIVIDDGSTDDTVSKIEALKTQKNIEHLVLLQQKNSGPSRARNAGIEIAEAEWVAFLDSDDYWSANALELHARCIDKHSNISLIGGMMDNANPSPTIKYTKINLVRCCFKNYFKTSTVLLKREVATRYKFDEKKKYSEDYKLWLEVCANYDAMYINQNLANQVIKKKAFGESGLSKDIVAIEKGELQNFRYLHHKKYISTVFYLFICCFSLLKFFRRYLLTKLRL